jgi:hypothetical protein
MGLTNEGLQLILNRINSDPNNRGYAGKTAFDMSVLANTLFQSGTMQTQVPIMKFLQWAATGPIDSVDLGQSSQIPQIRAICKAGIKLFDCGTGFDTQDPNNVAMLAALVQAQILTQDQMNALMAIGSVPVMIKDSVDATGQEWSAEDVQNSLDFGVNPPS